jgi:hypothetical protein
MKFSAWVDGRERVVLHGGQRPRSTVRVGNVRFSDRAGAVVAYFPANAAAPFLEYESGATTDDGEPVLRLHVDLLPLIGHLEEEVPAVVPVPLPTPEEANRLDPVERKKKRKKRDTDADGNDRPKKRARKDKDAATTADGDAQTTPKGKGKGKHGKLSDEARQKRYASMVAKGTLHGQPRKAVPAVADGASDGGEEAPQPPLEAAAAAAAAAPVAEPAATPVVPLAPETSSV